MANFAEVTKTKAAKRKHHEYDSDFTQLRDSIIKSNQCLVLKYNSISCCSAKQLCNTHHYCKFLCMCHTYHKQNNVKYSIIRFHCPLLTSQGTNYLLHSALN